MVLTLFVVEILLYLTYSGATANEPCDCVKGASTLADLGDLTVQYDRLVKETVKLKIVQTHMKEELTLLKQMLRNHQNEEVELRNEFHDTKMFVLKKVHASEEKLTWALGGGDRLPTAEEALALKRLRDGGDLRPIGYITSSLKSLTVYDSCEQAYEQGPKMSGVYRIRYNSTTSKDVNCLMEQWKESGFRTCEEVQAVGGPSGVYTIYPDGKTAVEVYCEMDVDGGGWTVIQQRVDGKDNFFRGWDDYVAGFGDRSTNFWVGLDNIRLLTMNMTMKLKIYMRHPDTSKGTDGYASADYSSFYIGDASSHYTLHLTGFTDGGAGDALKGHSGYKFTTKDADNDVYAQNCATLYKGGWWYTKCHSSNLNGIYGATAYAQGLTWRPYTNYHTSLTFVQMMVKLSS